MYNRSSISLNKSLIPIIILIFLLTINGIFGFLPDDTILANYSFHIILLFCAFITILIGINNGVNYKKIFYDIFISVKNIWIAIIILILVGALSGIWKISGIIPAMVYYGVDIPTDIFLPLTLVITALVSLTAGSSYITTATIGIALVAIGSAFNISTGITAGAVISGAYFGDKMSPLSDTTNLASAISGTDLYTHIKYMMYTTFPTFLLTFFIFCIIGISIESNTGINEVFQKEVILETLNNDFKLSPLLFLVPLGILIFAILKIKPIITLMFGVLFALVVALFYQSCNMDEALLSIFYGPSIELVFPIKSIITEPGQYPIINFGLEELYIGFNDLYGSGGILSMKWVITLTICAMVFGGCMGAIGALKQITNYLLSKTKTIFDLFRSTFISCIGVNITASDQYLSIILPGKMFKNAYKEKGLAPQNLSRTLEDTGTVTSALIPWNSCGAYHSGVLGVSTVDYMLYCFFNWISPLMTLVYAYFIIKIKSIIKS
tara:strand:+ start:14026 stop:15507 length:1482 start_codon:yes stop_codon:yes gene_type:complete